MMKITSKKDAAAWMSSFTKNARRDDVRNKQYFVFEDRQRSGQWTVMRYPDGQWTIHGKGDAYCDPDESPLSSEELTTFLWRNRAAVNRAMQTV